MYLFVLRMLILALAVTLYFISAVYDNHAGIFPAYFTIILVIIVELMMAFYHPLIGLPVLFFLGMSLIISGSELDNPGPISKKKRGAFYIVLMIYASGKVIQLIEVMMGRRIIF